MDETLPPKNLFPSPGLPPKPGSLHSDTGELEVTPDDMIGPYRVVERAQLEDATRNEVGVRLLQDIPNSLQLRLQLA